jgi:hypothetical protein
MRQGNQRFKNCLWDSYDAQNSTRSRDGHFLHQTVNQCNLYVVLYEGRTTERQIVVAFSVKFESFAARPTA